MLTLLPRRVGLGPDRGRGVDEGRGSAASGAPSRDERLADEDGAGARADVGGDVGRAR